ncbi:contractile injection system protein, VgrG/Pvc8 family [Pseudomonas sp. SZMC_28357]|uniref:type VI secretion system Vgr family protein n=1 Tax=Pseudomonas sp. SZMC_28357 TaxID=3074380 RepID=UPI002870D727|nr:contractile injection system protein, VgrG/Pvc8 family [Pseudomonas sp. SZMC_28357]MDR9752265.1 contractile injection system protein, VgrG/Pvc8 family [Pseudomonas sp. SZMC_28357]
MSDPANEPSFRLEVAGQPDAFEVQAFTGSESISEPFAFDLDLLIADPQLDLANLLYRSAWLSFGREGQGIHGHLQEVEQREHGESARHCRVRLGPRLSCLGLRISQRMFTACSVPQIIDQVLGEHGIVGRARSFELERHYPAQDFCTQYRESDLAFVQRLCAQAGIHYHFRHRRQGHCLVLSDGQASFDPGPQVRFEVGDGPSAVGQFQVSGSLGLVGLEQPPARMAEGSGHVAALRSGQWMALSGHPIAEWNQLWLLTRIEHSGSPDTYRNRFWASPADAPFIAAQPLAKPRMDSLQRAWVVAVDDDVAPAAEPRIAVQFDWLYQGEGAARSHCWLPLAPELGQLPLDQGTEVLVSFIEGDPDQPLISGLLTTPSTLTVEQVAPCESTAAAFASDTAPAPDALVKLLQASPPLVLLCLLPGGGSFSQCGEAVCTCRMLTTFNGNGAA